MRAVVILFMCAWAVAQDVNQMVTMPKYDARYDYLDVDTIFTNKRLVRNYVDCLVNSQRCSPEGKTLKRILPEALRTKCIRCTERQKRAAVKVIKRLKTEYPEEWAKVASRWDPTGDFTRYFEEFLAKEQFNSIPGSGPTINTIPNSSAQPSSAPPVQSELPQSTELTNELPAAVPLLIPQSPIVVNRFGADGELMVGSSSSGTATPRPMTVSTRPPTTTQTRATQTAGSGAASNIFPLRLPQAPTSSELPLPVSTAITIIDQIGYKIIRTTELVADLLKSTVRAVVGR